MDMDNGISLYPGLDNTPAENLALLEEAAHDGIRRIFTSLHIPETDVSALKQEIGTLLQAARRHGMEVISDVSPATCQLLDLPDFNPTSFRMLGITTLRLDYGFSAEEIARLTHRSKSTVSALVTKLVDLGYVARERSAEDSRVINLRLTEKGRAFIPVSERISSELDALVTCSLTPDEARFAEALLARILNGFSSDKSA